MYYVLIKPAALSSFVCSSASDFPSGRGRDRLCQARTSRTPGAMILMEGLMLVPPERGTIIGRAVWKVSRWSADSVAFRLTTLSLDMSSSALEQL